ncbi:MAG: hypothetical protein JRG86_12435 [Deltaproteobacteria bacterium]|nr:hypothetical protein [Deltaproteobacteria bacterium]MBW2498146.1 hypothetical protein [Deltaproteobacteria bacterium]
MVQALLTHASILLVTIRALLRTRREPFLSGNAQHFFVLGERSPRYGELAPL